jgi:hypothetical protein
MDPLTGPLADALRRNRQVFNAKFAAASKANTPIDPGEFQRFLAETLEPVVRNVASEFAERTDPVVDALFDLSLDLFRNNILGPAAKHPVIPSAWRTLLPRVAKLLTREPWRVAGSMTNALYNLSRTPGGRPNDWCNTDFSPCQTIGDFLDCGLIVAWRCGMPQYRRMALEKASALAPRLAAHALGLPATTKPEGVETVIRNLANNPWLLPQHALQSGTRQLKFVAQAGAFLGFGGQFLLPPRVGLIEDHLVVTDGTATWHVHADVFNAVLLRSDAPFAHPIANDAGILDDGTLQWKGLRRTFPELAHAFSIAATSDTAAITVPTSHHIFLVGLV